MLLKETNVQQCNLRGKKMLLNIGIILYQCFWRV